MESGYNFSLGQNVCGNEFIDRTDNPPLSSNISDPFYLEPIISKAFEKPLSGASKSKIKKKRKMSIPLRKKEE